MRVSLVIPTYNEARNLPILIDEIFFGLRQSGIELEVIVVDDNSPDGTGAAAEKLRGCYSLRVIRRPQKSGLGSAFMAGVQSSDRPIVGLMDADLSHDPAQIPGLIKAMECADISIGSRFLPGSKVENWAAGRKALSHAGVWVARLFTPASDPLSGFFFVRRAAIENLRPASDGYKILFEILLNGGCRKIAESPIFFRERRHGSTKLGFGEYLKFLKQILSAAGRKIKKRFGSQK